MTSVGGYGYNGGGVYSFSGDEPGAQSGLGLIPNSGAYVMRSWAFSTLGPRREGDAARPSEMIAIGDTPGIELLGGPGGPYSDPVSPCQPSNLYYSAAYNLSPVAGANNPAVWYLAGLSGYAFCASEAPAVLKRHGVRFNTGFCDGRGVPAAVWPEPDLDDAIDKLEWAYQNRDKMRALGQQAAKDLAERTWR